MAVGNGNLFAVPAKVLEKGREVLPIWRGRHSGHVKFLTPRIMARIGPGSNRHAEKITGAPLETYYPRRTFIPLRMVDTYAVPTASQSRVPTQHSRVNGVLREQPRAPVPSTPTAPFRGDGGLYSTAQDYGKFVRMLLNGGHPGVRENPK